MDRGVPAPRPTVNLQRGQSAACLQLCVFNLPPLHTPRPRARVGTRAEAGSTGVKEREAGLVELEEELEGGGVEWRGGATGRVSLPVLLDFKLNI